MIATVSGLDSITVGSLSERTGISKSGILTVFGSREAIQVAAVAEARRIYQEKVLAPIWSEPAGAPRLRALLRSWVDYLKAGVFPEAASSPRRRSSTATAPAPWPTPYDASSASGSTCSSRS